MSLREYAPILFCFLALSGCTRTRSAESRDAGEATAQRSKVVIHLHASGLLDIDQKPASLDALGEQLRRATEDKVPVDVFIETDVPQTDAKFLALRDKLGEVGVTKFSLATRAP